MTLPETEIYRLYKIHRENGARVALPGTHPDLDAARAEARSILDENIRFTWSPFTTVEIVKEIPVDSLSLQLETEEPDFRQN